MLGREITSRKEHPLKWDSIKAEIRIFGEVKAAAHRLTKFTEVLQGGACLPLTTTGVQAEFTKRPWYTKKFITGMPESWIWSLRSYLLQCDRHSLESEHPRVFSMLLAAMALEEEKHPKSMIKSPSLSSALQYRSNAVCWQNYH